MIDEKTLLDMLKRNPPDVIEFGDKKPPATIDISERIKKFEKDLAQSNLPKKPNNS